METKAPYSVRPMHPEDIAQVTEIDREAFPTQWPPPNYKHELQNQLARYIVVTDDNRTIEEPEVKAASGLASRIKWWFGRDSSPENPPRKLARLYIIGFSGIWVMADEAHITNIAVRKQYQRRGIGELLLISTIELAKEMKANTMTLEVRASNIAAQNLYYKFGFTQVGVRRGYYTDNREDGILMSTENTASPSFQAHLQQLKKGVSMKLDS